MAFRISFFNTPRPRVFNYRPLYFDPEKERWEQRRAQLRAKEGKIENEEGTKSASDEFHGYLFHTRPGEQIRGSFQRSLFESRRQNKENKFVRIVVIISIVMLFIAAYYLATGLGLLLRPS